MTFLLEFLELPVVLKSGLFEILGLHGQLSLKLMDLSSIKFLETGQLMLESLILDRNILVLMQKIVDFEL